MSTNTNPVVMTDEPTDMIPGTGWTWDATASAAKEHQREARLFGSGADAVLARHGEGSITRRSERGGKRVVAAKPVTTGEGIDAEALEHAHEVEALHRLHPRRIDQIMHRHGECSCVGH